MSVFHHILVNSLIANVTNFTIWFALTFWVFLETRSVLATGMIAGIYLVLTAGLGIWLGSLVDRHRKTAAMAGSSLASLAFYAAAVAAYMLSPDGSLRDVSSSHLWLFVLIVMLGVIAGNVRTIALPTVVTLLFPAEARDKANGLVGMVNGIGFVTTSAISGFLIAWGGMPMALGFGLALTLAALIHLRFVHLDEPPPNAGAEATTHVDLKGTILVVAAVPGLFALILLAAFNNFLGGVFMALLDAYGLSLMRVEAWGLLWAVASCALILSGIVVARTGLGSNPVRTLLLANLAMWIAGAVFTVQSSIPLLAAGCIVWLFLTPIAEAAEQTTLQKVVPFERQGRVFGFAQSVEQAAAPLTAFLIAPLAQFVFVPTMTDGAGAAAIGDWFGRGPERGIALLFTVAGALGVIATLVAFSSRAYRQLSGVYAER